MTSSGVERLTVASARLSADDRRLEDVKVLLEGDGTGGRLVQARDGSLLITSILANDTPVIMAITFVFSGLVVLFNMLADLLYGWLDPRIRVR